MGLNYIKFSLLLISAILLQPIAFAAGQPTYQFILPPDGQKDQAFHMVVIGDSVAWGNGLEQTDKYYYQLAKWLQESLNKPIDVKVYAHSGATIDNPTGELGKSTNANLNSWYPTLMDQATSIQNADEVDLILVSGGINDVDVMKILDIYTPAEDIDRRSQSIKGDMKNLLSYLLSKNKNAKIIVTNYYPLISDDTNQDALYTLFNVFSQLFSTAQINLLDTLNHKSRLTENSYTFSGVTTSSLTNAVKEADNNVGRIGFAMVNFQPSNCYGASGTWLWTLESVVPPKTNDDYYKERAKLCKPIDITNILDKDNYINYINAMGHPNVAGAKEYTRAIKSAVKPSWLKSWLKNDIPTTSSTNDGTAPGTSGNLNSDGLNNLPDLSQWLKSLSAWVSTWTNMLPSMLPSTAGWPLYAVVIVLALIIGLSLIRRSLWDFIMNAISGLVVIYLSSMYLGIGIAINIPTLLVCGIGGFPGAIILIALKYFYGITF